MTKGRKVISKYITGVKRHGNGAHVIVPKEWIGIEVEVMPVTVAREESPPPIKTKEELKNKYSKFDSHAKAAARLARRNIDYSPEPGSKK